MTPILKVRREEVERHRAAEIEALYLLGRSRSPARSHAPFHRIWSAAPYGVSRIYDCISGALIWAVSWVGDISPDFRSW
jgi:phage terminase large subunit-like protein